MHEAREALVRISRLNTMGELSASIAHEINQPLGAIVANGQACLRFLSAEPPDLEEVKEAVDEMVSDGRRASEVLRRIRVMVRNTAPERKPFDVNGAISEVVALTRHEREKQRVSVRIELGDDLPLVVADRVQVQQVVLNLVMNGVEAMHEVENRPRVLTVKSTASDDQTVAVAVEDLGTGFDSTNFGRLFDPFFTTKTEGMGMGLSICNSIVRAHGGRLSASPGSTHGAVFCFTLPTTREAVR
jgi:C4-dicarboxylate-specific signal transduction histidine kinase